jgi:hypothetical protein
MARFYVPLDVNYAEDDKVIEVGPMAELLYVRSLAFAKRAKKNGRIENNQLSSFAMRLPRVRGLSDQLFDAGLWERNGTGLYVSAWLKHNAAVEEQAEVKSVAGKLGNHRKWHVGPEGKPSPDCKICVAEGLV